MNAREYYYSKPKERLEKLASDAGTTFANFQQIAIANGSVSSRLARRLEEASEGEMTLVEILFPSDSKTQSA